MKQPMPEKPAEAKTTLHSRFIHAAMDQNDPRSDLTHNPLDAELATVQP
jgi:hypothetical protein